MFNPQNQIHNARKTKNYFAITSFIYNFVACHSKDDQTYLLYSLSFTTTSKKSKCTLELPRTGRRFLPYMCMVCGEPRGVWRKSAPFCVAYVKHKPIICNNYEST
jgi:hypothetical protein